MRSFYALTFKPLTLYPNNQTNSQFQVRIARKLKVPNVSHPTLRFHRMKSSAFAAKHFDALFTTFLEHGLLKFQYFTILTPMPTLQQTTETESYFHCVWEACIVGLQPTIGVC